MEFDIESMFGSKKVAYEYDKKIENKQKKYLKTNKYSCCVYAGCKKYAINSHSISKKISLHSISDSDKQIFSPLSIKSSMDKNIIIKELGTNEASTFKGFCEEHEKLFVSLDNSSITTDYDLFLQIYRGLNYHLFRDELQLVDDFETREMFKNNIIFEFFKDENMMGLYLNMPIKKQKKIMQCLIESIEKKLSIENSSDIVQEKNKKLTQFIENIHKNNLLMKDRNRVINSSSSIEFNDRKILYRKLNYQIPLAMNAQHYSMDKNIGQIFLMCIPYKNETDVIMICDHNSYSNKIEGDILYSNNKLKLLNILENIMICSLDWWIKPDLIKCMSLDKKKMIEEDLYCLKQQNLTINYDVSIFNELRKTFIEENSKYLFRDEINKLYNLPKREKFKERKKRFQENLINEKYNSN